LLVANAQAAWSSSDGFTLRGSVGAEVRVFALRPSYAGQDGQRGQLSAVASGKISWQSAARDVTVDVAPFIRVDAVDDRRTHADLREASITYSAGAIDIRAGIGKVYWGVTESRKLVDIVNQSDLVEEPKGDEKLGQPMVMLRGRVGDFEASGFILPVFRDRTFPGVTGRLRPSIVIDTDIPEFESGHGRQRIDTAFRLKGRLDVVDAGVSYFSGTSREPRLVYNGANLVPVYDTIDQAGLDVQATLGSTLLKFEGIVRDGHRGAGAKSFAAIVVGVEHTINQFAGTGWDLGLIAEYNWDGRPLSAPVTIYDRDLFAGARIAFNDTGDSTALGGILYDVEKGSAYATIESSTRVGESMRLEVEGTFVLHADDLDAALLQVQNDSFVTVRFLQFI
jgi:hypothetical protein